MYLALDCEVVGQICQECLCAKAQEDTNYKLSWNSRDMSMLSNNLYPGYLRGYSAVDRIHKKKQLNKCEYMHILSLTIAPEHVLKDLTQML